MPEVQVTSSNGFPEVGCLLWLDESFGYLVQMSLPVTHVTACHLKISAEKHIHQWGLGSGFPTPHASKKKEIIGGYGLSVDTDYL